MKTPRLNAKAAETFAAMQSIMLRTAMAGDLNAIKPNAIPKHEVQVLKAVEAAGVHFSAQSRVAAAAANIARGNLTQADMPLNVEESGLVPRTFENDESQAAAISKLAAAHYGALIGAAGTGKTTIVKQLVARLIYGSPEVDQLGLRTLNGKQGPSIALVAFTGTASSVIKSAMPAWAGPMCKTIHTLLEYAPVSEGSNMFEPKRNHKNKLEHDAIFIDEAGQLGLNLWHNLIDACQPWTRIYLIGDINQLPPIADSPFFPRVLADALSTNPTWILCELTKVHRQTGEGGNKVLAAAHAILAGKPPVFDMTEDSPPPKGTPWFVAGIQLPNKTEDAHSKVIKFMNAFRKMNTIGEDLEPETRKIYMPYDDLLLTPGNGFEPGSKGAAIQQASLNQTISSLIIADFDNDGTHVIDAGRVSRDFAIGDRVMCCRNEEHGTVDRVTNGTLGVITDIKWNPEWNGERMKFGKRSEVLKHQQQRLATMLGESHEDNEANRELDFALESLATADFDMLAANQKYEKQASHIVTVQYKNGATRSYKTAIGVENLVLAYATTTAKAQGGQADTVFIVCHSAVSFQLNREWLYTSVTRAQRRIVIFYTDLGLRSALAKQQIYGATLLDKIKRYVDATGIGDKLVRLTP